MRIGAALRDGLRVAMGFRGVKAGRGRLRCDAMRALLVSRHVGKGEGVWRRRMGSRGWSDG